jgi:hypothetical protein
MIFVTLMQIKELRDAMRLMATDDQKNDVATPRGYRS